MSDIDILDPNTPGSQLISARTIAKLLDIRPVTWLAWSRAGKVPAPYPLGEDTDYRWRVSDIRLYLEQNRQRYISRYQLDE